MKKDRKISGKLTLNRETVRNLEEAEIRLAAGGDSKYNSCDPYTIIGCGTVKTTCC